LVSKDGEKGSNLCLVRPSKALVSPFERCCLIVTAGLWPWKLAPAKECVIAHQPNEVALKMDEVQLVWLY